MTKTPVSQILARAATAAQGPLYLRLRHTIEQAVGTGELSPDQALPSEREIAVMAAMSRVTVRKAMQCLVSDGLLVQRRGSGTFVAPQVPRVEQSLSKLTSFSEDMARRGMAAESEWLDRGLYEPTPDEIMVLGLSAGEKVARLSRLRLSGGTPLAVERAAIAASILPDPDAVGDSLYATLAERGNRPVRAIQRIAATNLMGEEAERLAVAPGTASLRIERTSYLESGRIVEFTRSTYRGDAYDFIAELRL